MWADVFYQVKYKWSNENTWSKVSLQWQLDQADCKGKRAKQALGNTVFMEKKNLSVTDF